MDLKFAVSKAGHDKDSIYVIIKEEADMVYLADGRHKPLEKPKKKNKKHIQAANCLVIEKFPVTDDEIYTRLRDYVKCREQKNG